MPPRLGKHCMTVISKTTYEDIDKNPTTNPVNP